MAKNDRRTFLWASTAVAAGTAMRDLDTGTEGNAIKETASQSLIPTPTVTKTLARFIVAAGYESLPEKVRKTGVRTLLNWVGVAVGGSRHETVNIAVDALAPFSGPAQATRERFDVMNAAFVNGVASHIFDYDDTHLKTIIHPAGPVGDDANACEAES